MSIFLLWWKFDWFSFEIIQSIRAFLSIFILPASVALNSVISKCREHQKRLEFQLVFSAHMALQQIKQTSIKSKKKSLKSNSQHASFENHAQLHISVPYCLPYFHRRGVHIQILVNETKSWNRYSALTLP